MTTIKIVDMTIVKPVTVTAANTVTVTEEDFLQQINDTVRAYDTWSTILTTVGEVQHNHWQELFNIVWDKLNLQGVASTSDNGTCRYRGAMESHKCAAGHLIQDKYYGPNLEGMGCESVAVRKALHMSGVQGAFTIALCSSVQTAHDRFLTGRVTFEGCDKLQAWRKAMELVAQVWSLQVPPIPEKEPVNEFHV